MCGKKTDNECVTLKGGWPRIGNHDARGAARCQIASVITSDRVYRDRFARGRSLAKEPSGGVVVSYVGIMRLSNLSHPSCIFPRNKAASANFARRKSSAAGVKGVGGGRMETSM